MLTMRAAALLGLLFGLGASCLGYELALPSLTPDVALLGLLLCFAYLGAETYEFIQRFRRRSRRRAPK